MLYLTIAGWWLTYPSQKHDGVKVSWDDENHSQLFLESHKTVPNHQADSIYGLV